MSRVSEAMRRAGYQQPEHLVSGSDDAFESTGHAGDTSAGDPSEYSGLHSAEAPQTHVPHAAPTEAAPTEAAGTSVVDDVRIHDVLRILYRRRWVIATVIILSLAAGAAYNYSALRIYQARARVLIEPTAEEVVPFRSATGEDVGRFDYFLTQLDVLRSQALARETLRRTNRLSTDPTAQAAEVNEFLYGLTVTTSKTEAGESRVVNIAYQSTNPRLAAQMANALAQAYVDQNLELRRQGSLQAAKWLNQRVDELRKEVSATESALQRYREQKDAVSLDSGQNVVVQKFAQLNGAYTSARTDRVQKQTLYEQLMALQKTGAPLDTFPPILANSFIQGVKAELAALQSERSQLAEKLGELHPDMIKVNTAIENAQRRLNAETAKVVEGIKNDYIAAQANERGLAAALDAQKGEVLSLNQKSIGYNELQRDAASTQQTFTTVLQRAKETELAAELQSNNIKILDLAGVPEIPILPRTRLNLVVSLFGGSFFALVLVFGIERLNPRIVEPDDVARTLGLPLLGVAPQVSGIDERSAMLTDLPYPLQEAVRSIRTQLLLSPSAAGVARSVAVTSARPGEGKTLIASNLAVSMAMAGRRVLLVDADLRRPRLHQVFNVAKSPGLSNVISGGNRPSEALVESPVKGLFILPAGADVSAPADLLDSERLDQLLQGFRQVFDVVLLDCPPVMAVSDASIVANAATSVVFVIAAGTTSPEGAQAALERLHSVKARVVGAVLNKATLSPRSDYYQYYAADARA
jgi:capsular exopolysaccharide synthesis family protein